MNTKSNPLLDVLGFLGLWERRDPVFAMAPKQARHELLTRIVRAFQREAYAEALPSLDLLEKHDGFLDETMHFNLVVALDKGGNPPEARRRATLHISRFGRECLHAENLKALIAEPGLPWAANGASHEAMQTLLLHAKALHKLASAMGIPAENLAEFGRRELTSKEALALSNLCVNEEALRRRGVSEDEIAYAAVWFENMRKNPAIV